MKRKAMSLIKTKRTFNCPKINFRTPNFFRALFIFIFSVMFWGIGLCQTNTVTYSPATPDECTSITINANGNFNNLSGFIESSNITVTGPVVQINVVIAYNGGFSLPAITPYTEQFTLTALSEGTYTIIFNEDNDGRPTVVTNTITVSNCPTTTGNHEIELPTSPDECTAAIINASGELRNDCISVVDTSFTINGNVIDLDVSTLTLQGQCAQVVNPYSFDFNVGILSQGSYTVNFYEDSELKTSSLMNVGACGGLTCNRERDSLSLVALYNSTDGANWTNTWDLSQTIDTWYGVVLNSRGCVRCLDLDGNPNCGFLVLNNQSQTGGNNLKGQLPSELGNLSDLQVLSMDGDSLNGQFPSSITALTNLRTLNLSDHQLSGQLPNGMKNLTALENLIVVNNNFSGELPSELGELASLRGLFLSANDFTGEIPISYGNLSELVELEISRCNLSGSIPAEIGQLSKLNELILFENNLEGCFPDELLTHCNTTYFLNNNPALPWQGDFERFCNGEQQEGATCDDGDANTQNDVIQADCSCQGVILNTCRSADSTVLALIYNNTGGASWNIQWDLSQPMNFWNGVVLNTDGCVEQLSLPNNNLTGDLPTEIGQLSELTNLSLVGNNLTGQVPVELGDLQKVTSITIGKNQWSGTVPANLFNAPLLDFLNIDDSDIDSLPPITSTNIQNFWINGNALTFDDVLPYTTLGLNAFIYFSQDSFYTATTFNVQEGDPLTIDLGIDAAITTNVYNWYKDGNFDRTESTNQLTFPSIGTGDAGVYRCEVTNPNAPGLTLYSRNITINVTPTGPHCRQQDSLALIALYNSTDGANWTNIWDLSQPLDTWYGVTLNVDGCVNDLALSDNQLAGSIPIEIGSLHNLNSLWLFGNELSGNIPPNLGNLINLTILSLHSNNLSGPIPPDISNLSKLIWLTLSNNELSGNIPEELGDLSNLTRIQFSMNQLSGDIPIRISNLLNLRVLDIWENELSGNIPKELGRLSNLETLYLHGNNLSGNIPEELGDLTNLTVLSLGNNELNGFIPVELSNLNKLKRLYLHDNNLEGCFPSELNFHCGMGFGIDFTQDGYNFTNNPALPWSGDFDRFCNGEQQEGATCDDGDPNTQNDVIQADCSCRGTITSNECGAIPGMSFYAPDTTVFQDERVCVEIRTQDFDNVLTFQWTMAYDSTIIELDSAYAVALPAGSFKWSRNSSSPNIGTPTPSQIPQGFLYKNGTNKIISCSWLEPNFGGHTLNTDCQVIFNICFDAIGNVGQVSPLIFDDSPTDVEVADSDSNILLDDISSFANGSVTISGGNPCRQSDSLALIALYNSTDGANWTNTWDLSQPIDTWFGVSLNGAGCVECLDMGGTASCSGNNTNGNNLVGTIAMELGNLSNLTKLTLFNNELSGSIPRELGNLSNLTWLELSLNDLSGDIPLELGNLSNLEFLSLSRNQLSGSIPRELGNLSNLESLSFNTNMLSGIIPLELGNLSKLEFLSLSGNMLSGNVPAELGNLSNLGTLWLYNNQLSGSIPAELGNLSNLGVLSLSGNMLSGNVPAELGNLSNLGTLWLYNNQLEGCFPSELESHCGIPYVNNPDPGSGNFGYNLTGNLLLPWSGDFERFCNGEQQEGAPCDDGDPNTIDDQIQADCSCRGVQQNNCRQRDSLALVALYNSTDGANWTNTWDLNNSIDTWYGVTLNVDGCVECLDLDGDDDCDYGITGNNLRGSIPKELSNLSNLKSLYLSNNQLSGSIPVELGNLNDLIDLHLSNNQLTGAIPSEISNLANLVDLSLHFNQLSGSIPAVFSNLTSLKRLVLYNNRLNGSIPKELGSLPNLTELHLYMNQISGPIPIELGNLNQLSVLYLSQNQLNGSIPPELANLSSLSVFFLQENDLEGCIPPQLIGLCNTIYDLSGNPALPWSGDFERFCDGESQIGAPCDDGDPATGEDMIQADCSCSGTLCLVPAPSLVFDKIEIDSSSIYQIDVVSNDNLNGATDITVNLLNLPPEITVWQYDAISRLITLEPASGTTGNFSFDYEICQVDCPDLCDTTTVDFTIRGNATGFPDEGETNIVITPMTKDGLNDFLIFDDLSNYPNNNLYIYNRWGNVVFSAAPYKNDWDGSRRGKPLPEGTYYYVMRKTLPDKIQYGSVTIKY